MTTRTTRRAPKPRAVVMERPGRPKMVVYVFGRFVRIAHWIRNAALIWMVASGIYIGNPFLARNLFTETSEGFILAQVRGWHVAAGWLLLALTLVRIYQYLFVRADGRLGLGRELRMAPIVFNWKAWRDQLRFYFLTTREHPHYTYSNYGPLQFLVYTILYASLLLISITGILLVSPYVQGGLASFGADLLRPFEVWMGGLANVRAVHRYTMWFFVIFTAVHVYMAVWTSLRTGNMLVESMISGFHAEDATARPADEEELAPAVRRDPKQGKES